MFNDFDQKFLALDNTVKVRVACIKKRRERKRKTKGTVEHEVQRERGKITRV